MIRSVRLLFVNNNLGYRVPLTTACMTHRREPSRLPIDYYYFSDNFGHIDAHDRFISLGGGYKGLLKHPSL